MTALSENILDMYEKLGISKALQERSEVLLQGLQERFAQIDAIAEYNQMKVIHAMQKQHVSETDFIPTTGYGYNDIGRDKLEAVYADTFHCEDALVRPQLLSGTHALTVALFGVLRPGDVMLSVAGKPYDTLDEVIGLHPASGSLAEFGVTYHQVDLLEGKRIDYTALEEALRAQPKVVYLQRSKGYETRHSFAVEEIGELVTFVRRIHPAAIIMVDNCYGEFTQMVEPTDVGVDLMIGSLIKNPGGGLAPIGGYIAGKKQYVEMCASRMSSPGLGKEVGPNLGLLTSFYQGFFMAPTVVAGAIKGAIFAARLYEDYGFSVLPASDEPRYDLIQSVIFHKPEGVCAFCKGVQAAAAVDSFVTPEPWDMPGYDAPVIMAAGAFVQGSSIELSADGPMKPPYVVYFQGGITWYHAKLGVLKSMQEVLDAGFGDM